MPRALSIGGVLAILVLSTARAWSSSSGLGCLALSRDRRPKREHLARSQPDPHPGETPDRGRGVSAQLHGVRPMGRPDGELAESGGSAAGGHTAPLCRPPGRGGQRRGRPRRHASSRELEFVLYSPPGAFRHRLLWRERYHRKDRGNHSQRVERRGHADREPAEHPLPRRRHPRHVGDPAERGAQQCHPPRCSGEPVLGPERRHLRAARRDPQLRRGHVEHIELNGVRHPERQLHDSPSQPQRFGHRWDLHGLRARTCTRRHRSR